MQFEGMKINDLAAIAGRSRGSVIHWLRDQGYRVADGRILKTPHPHEMQDEIARRQASAPYSAPCFKCGAARDCSHREARRQARAA